MRDKNPSIPLNKMIKLLFHGTKTMSPLEIALSEVGLDKGFAN